MTTPHPYKNLPPQAYWSTAVRNVHFADIDNLWEPMPLKKTDRVATAGSCFAQHLGINLAKRGARFMDMEPAPITFSSDSEKKRWGFGVFSARFGNIYTARQLLQLIQEVLGQRSPQEIVWEKDGRYFDALRPGIDPVGQSSAEEVIELRSSHLRAVRRMFSELDVLVFTMGLTEGWGSVGDGTVYPVAPGTVAGEYDPNKYFFKNWSYGEILEDMNEFWRLLHSINPGARMLLTVSPVPLAATATSSHVLVATTYSKSVLRAVAGDLAEQNEDIWYFPSYEIISSPPFRGSFFEPDARSVNQFGVDLVMKNFFSGRLGEEFGGDAPLTGDDTELICDEEVLDVHRDV
ncbi:MAG: GSCFA domain-containing protein [Propionibacteriaceae bacterium]|nr:GSCFA domain-containing protein [Propionibacteriaceae bacterium]